MSRKNIIDLVITEDSDLIVFGAKEIFYKMDSNYKGCAFKTENIYYCEEMNIRHWDHSKLI